MRVEQVQAIVLTGGSAFGLATADGVMRQLAEIGRGHPTPAGPVPIVPAAVVFDLMVGDGSVRPGPSEGAAAYLAASDAPVEMGLRGAGAGTTVAKWRGFDHSRPGGLGSASLVIDGATIGALVVLNAVGDVFSLEGESLTGADPHPGPHGLVPGPFQASGNTTLAVIGTDARLNRLELARLCIRGHDAFGACIRPAHTRFDGDVVFAASCGAKPADLENVAEGAFNVVGKAIEAAVKASGQSSDPSAGLWARAPREKQSESP
jgi:L-aminopeptidase/D-esterase-like protein